MAEGRSAFSGPELFWESSAFEFDDVVMELFPLRANPNRLRQFCRRYLNIAPPEMAEFRPALPFVLMAAIHYPRMSDAAARLGWVPQNEVLFSVPVEWRRRGGRWGRHWASASPFIFVDSARSTLIGREAYGWPKVLAEFEAGPRSWRAGSGKRRHVLTLRTLMFSELYAGEPLRLRPLVEVRHRDAPTLLHFPPDLRELMLPALRWPGVAMDLGSLILRTDTGTLLAWMRSMAGALATRTTRRSANTINLKQFRSSDSGPLDSAPNRACYQALVNAPLVFTRYHGSGFLGDNELLRGDPTGGCRVRIHRNPSYPIVESLGLEITREGEGEGGRYSVLEPALPFWLRADLRYDPAETICWRAEDRGWSTGAELGEKAGDGGLPPYLTTLGPVAHPIEGPFEFRDAAFRLIPLAARSGSLDEAKGLSDLIDRCLGDLKSQTGIGCELVDFGPDKLVLLVVSSYGQLSAPANDVGWWARHQLAFAVPLIITLGKSAAKGEQSAAKKQRSFPALFWPYVFSDSPIAVTTGREFSGLPTQYGRLAVGRDPWLEPRWRGERNLMSLFTKEFPALGVGQGEVERVLLEAVEVGGASWRPAGPGARRGNGSETSAPAPGLTVAEDHPDLARAARPEVQAPVSGKCENEGDGAGPAFAGGLYIDNIILKQFRDAENLNQPCYQALVLSRTWIGHRDEEGGWPEIHFADRDHEVRIHRYASQPIVDDLGLIPEGSGVAADGSRFTIHRSGLARGLEGPVWLQADLRLGRGRTLFWRGLSGDWQQGEGVGPIEEAARRDSGSRSLRVFLNALMTRVIPFERGEWGLGPLARERLDAVAHALLADPGLHALATGHARDEGEVRGPPPGGGDARVLNLKEVGELRARTARSYLKARHGIPRRRVRVVSHGDLEPVLGRRDDDPVHRRAEVLVHGARWRRLTAAQASDSD